MCKILNLLISHGFIKSINPDNPLQLRIHKNSGEHKLVRLVFAKHSAGLYCCFHLQLIYLVQFIREPPKTTFRSWVDGNGSVSDVTGFMMIIFVGDF